MNEFVAPQICNFDDLFSRTPDAITLNELIVNKSSQEIIAIICDLTDDNSELIAKCTCEHLDSNYYEGKICPKCNTVCQSTFGNIIKNDIWFLIPDAITAVLNPIVFHMLNSWLGAVDKKPILEIILNHRQEVPESLQPIILDQGFNYLYDNFDAIIDYFSNIQKNTANKPIRPYIQAFLQLHADNIWCTRLPLVSKALQPVTYVGSKNRNVGYVDDSIKLIMKSITDFKSTLIADKLRQYPLKRIETDFYSVYTTFGDYTASIAKDKLASKPGIFRKHCFGARFHCSGRSVCIPIVEEHWGDEVFLPWILGVKMWYIHIESLLVNRYHKSLNDAHNQVSLSMTQYDYQVDKCMQILIKESPYKGLPIVLNRNPSLHLGAIQLLFVTKIKPSLTSDPKVAQEVDFTDSNIHILGDSPTDKIKYVTPDWVKFEIADKTLELSPMVINAPNADIV